ncbi:MAG: 30S ribosomal protein S13 [Planctomycetota bacterium]|nr:MAG: 30S ribosomal protein S13 [Planctomycetota bacterium]
MPRIAGVDIPNDKQMWVALTYIHGIGTTKAKQILDKLGIDPHIKARDLTEDEVQRIAQELDRNHVVEGMLRRQVAQNIQRLKEIRCYRGIRHIKNLPVRGQRTKTNARQRKGKRRTVATKKSVKAMR